MTLIEEKTISEISEVQKPQEKIDPIKELHLHVSKKYAIPYRMIEVKHLWDINYRVNLLEYREILMTDRLVTKTSHFIKFEDNEIIYQNPEFPKNGIEI